MRGLSEHLQALAPLVKVMPIEAARALLVASGSLYFALKADERRAIEGAIGDLLHGQRRDLAATRRETFAHTFEHYFEKLLVATKPLAWLKGYVAERIGKEGFSALDEALARGKGVLGVTAHWGAVELIPAVLMEAGYPLSIVLEVKTEALKASLEATAAACGAELIIASRGDRVLERILDALARGRIVLTQVDEVDAWRRRPSRTVELFGKKLFFDHTVDFIAKRSGAAAVGLFCRRLPGRRYRLRCEDLVLDPTKDDVSLKALKLWERYTLEAPEQWYQWKKWPAMKPESA